MHGLTDRQTQCLEFIRNAMISRGFPPTLREIERHMGIRSTNGVNDHLRALERKGYIQREDMMARSIRMIVDSNENASPAAPCDEEGMVQVKIYSMRPLS